MFEPLSGLPDGVIGFEAVGEIHSEDYVSTLLPAIDAAATTGPIRFVYVLGERFEGYSSGATWQDAKLGVHHHGKWYRLALVTDLDWAKHLAGALGWMIPGEFKRYGLSEQDEAVAWVAAD